MRTCRTQRRRIVRTLPVAAVILSLSLIGASTLLAAAEKEATVDSVLEKYVKAIGGKEAWNKVRDPPGQGGAEGERRDLRVDLGGQGPEQASHSRGPARRRPDRGRLRRQDRLGEGPGRPPRQEGRRDSAGRNGRRISAARSA